MWSVLIIDDEPDNLEVVAAYFKFLGATVKTATGGQVALDMLVSFRPDLILLDLSMPHMDGWEMKIRLRNNPTTHATPVVALTAHSMPTDKERVRQAGFTGYLTKPINLPTLVKDIQETVESFNVSQEQTNAS